MATLKLCARLAAVGTMKIRADHAGRGGAVDFQGQTIHDRYVVAGLLGEGGDATVYRAEDRLLGRSVALKFLRPELRADPTFVARGFVGWC